MALLTTFVLLSIQLRYISSSRGRHVLVNARNGMDVQFNAIRNTTGYLRMPSFLPFRNPNEWNLSSAKNTPRDTTTRKHINHDDLKIENVFYTRLQRRNNTVLHAGSKAKTDEDNDSFSKDETYTETVTSTNNVDLKNRTDIFGNNFDLKTFVYSKTNQPNNDSGKAFRDVQQSTEKTSYDYRKNSPKYLFPRHRNDMDAYNQSRLLKLFKEKALRNLFNVLRKKNTNLKGRNTSFTDPQLLYRRRKTEKLCSEKQNIAFLKVHKCGSSTVANIIQRFVLGRDLNVVLPFKPRRVLQYNYLGYDNLFDQRMVVPPPSGESLNVLYNHVVYKRNTFKKLLPNNTFYFAIVREPVSKFLSAMRYYNYAKQITKSVYKRKFGVNYINVSSFDSKILDLDPTVLSDFLKDEFLIKMYSKNRYLFNSMAYDFGIPRDKTENLLYVRQYLQSLDKEFHFVMIMEHFDESLILLKRYLCWDHKTIMYVAKKRSDGSKTNRSIQTASDLTDEAVRIIQQSQKADMMIYSHFNESFWRLMSKASPDFFSEVKYFKEVRSTVAAFCKRNPIEPLFVEPSVWDPGFHVSREDCIAILSPELVLHDQIIVKALEKIRRSHRILI